MSMSDILPLSVTKASWSTALIRPLMLSTLTMHTVFAALSMPLEYVQAEETATRLGTSCDIRTFGAVADDLAFDTVAIQAAIDACATTEGQVLVPPGRWLTGTLHLRSNIDFHLTGGAILMGSTSFDDYEAFSRDPKRTDPRRWYRAHIVGLGVENVTISGQGTIDGQGEPFWEDHYAKGRPDIEQRPERQIAFADCRNVRVEDVTITSAAIWGLVYQDCDDVTTDGISV
jgi:polygalacturonase